MTERIPSSSAAAHDYMRYAYCRYFQYQSHNSYVT